MSLFNISKTNKIKKTTRKNMKNHFSYINYRKAAAALVIGSAKAAA